MSRSVRDTAAALDATAGPEIGDPYAAPPAPGSYLAATKRKPKKLRIAFATKRLGGEAFDPECKAATEAAAKLCAKLGHHIEESLPQVSPDDIGANFLPIWASGLTTSVDLSAKTTGKTPTRDEFEGLTWSLYQFGKTITAAQYQLCWASLQRATRQVAAWQQPYDALITQRANAVAILRWVGDGWSGQRNHCRSKPTSVELWLVDWHCRRTH